MDKDAVNQIINAFGGVSGICGTVEQAGWPLNPGSVYKWRNVGRIPELWGTRLIVSAEKRGQALNRNVLLRALGSSSAKADRAA